ncbi:UPF0606 protein KIAA1549 homolog isoform X3 [Dendrobates tinctorius]|uniref:UPF0606 protein KIAA1549 homolog isoform X3 n=1 Tax=Dendrobates tinctorius TaxID=92724 RepID=UPI003CC99D4C
MERGLRAAPAARTILLLGIWLQLHRVAAEVVHFGPLLLKVDEDSTVTKNASVPEERVQDVNPVTISSNELAPSETIAHQLPDSQPVVEPTRTPWPLPDDVFLSPSLSMSPLLSLASVIGDSATTQLSEMYDARSDAVELSSGVYITTSSVTLEQSVNMASRGTIEDDVTVPPPDTFYQTPWAMETLPIFIEDGEVITSSFTLESTKSGQPPTDSFFGSSIKGSMVAHYTPASSATSWPATPVESILPSLTYTQEVTSTATKYPLSSIFSDLGLLTLRDSTTSPSEALSVTSPSYETSYFPDPEISSSFLQSSVPPDISETWSTTGTDVTYTQWWSEDYVETVSIQTSGFPGDLLPTSLITSQKTSLVDVLDSVLSSLPTPFIPSLYTDLMDSSVDLTNIVDSTEVLVTLVSSVPSSEKETRWVSSVESTSTLMPSLLISSMTSVDLETFSSTEISSLYLLESSLYEPLNTAEAPAFVPTESGMYFPPTTSLSVESKYFTLVSTLEPDGLFSSSVEEVAVSSPPLGSSHVSAYEPQESSSVLSISESMITTPFSEFYSTSIRETISMEVIPLNSTSFPSPSPSSIDWTESFSSEFWKSTIMTSSVLYTSSTGATSLLPLPSSSALNTTTSALPTSSFGFDHTISALVEEVLPTSLLTLVQSMTLPPESDSSGFFTSLFSVNTLMPPGFTAALSMPPTSAISLESTVDYAATDGQTSTYPTSTVSVPWSSQPSSSPVFLLTTPQILDVWPSPSPAQPVTTIDAITRSSADLSPSQPVTTTGTTASPSAHLSPTLPVTTTGTTASPSAHPSSTLPVTTTGTTASPSAHPSPTLPVTTTGTTASPSAHPSPTLPVTTTGTTASPSAHPSSTLPVTTTGTTASPSAHPSPTLPVTTTGTTASPSAHPSPTLPVTTTGTTASPSAHPSPTLPVTTTGTTASPSAHPSQTLPVTTTGTTASPSAHPSPTLPVTTTGTTASPSAHPSSTLPVTTTGTTASPSAHPSPTLPVTTTGTTASPSAHPSPTLPVTTATSSAQPFTTTPPSSSTPAAITHNILDTTTPQVTTTTIITPGATTVTSTLPAPVTPPSGLTATTTVATTRPSFVCDVSNPEPYLLTVVLSRGSNIENVTETIKETLTVHFNRSVELEVFSMSDSFSFLVTSGPLVYTAIAVSGVLSGSGLVIGRFPPILSLRTAFMGIELRFHVQTVLQFVPQSVDIRLCTFSEQIQKGLILALYEVRRLRQEIDDFTVQIVNISSSTSRLGNWKAPVTVSYAVRERSGFLNGSDVSDQLRNLSLVEFSFFLGFPVKQIAEPSTYPQLDISPLLKDSWLRTILLGVQEQRLQDETFQTEMERKLAQIISEATSQKRRWKRASYAGSTTVQVVNVSRVDGQDDPVQLVYFIEDQYGERLAADKASSLINEVNIQRAAIILGYRLQGVVAQPLNQPAEADRQAQNMWIIVGVAVPVLVVTVIIVILYWKLCRTDKLDFQPDTISNLQQRQKQLQAPNVKGFDFAKQHLGQHNKDEVLVVHEPPPPVLHGPLKDSTPSENGDIPTPRSKCSTKPNKIGRHRSRVTPSDTGSTASEPSSGKESGEEGPRPSAPPQETRLRPIGKGEIPALGSGAEQHSSASIFEHVDRMSRSSEASRRLPSKIQLIAMQPMAALPMHGQSTAEREVEANKVNREIQTTLRHKSEIEHHRNKIRLRAKRKGHYEFPLVDVVGMTDTKERQRMYRRAQMQFDKILDPVLGVPTVFIEPRKSSRSRRSPKQRRKQQGSSSPPDADRDRLITTDSDGTYKRPPGVSNSAYVSDPDIPSDSPTPVSEIDQYPGSPPRLPAPYVAPQPSIEEVRQTMQSLLDDAFALVAPSSQGPGALQSGNTSGQHVGNSSSARTGQGSAPWQYPSHQSSHYNRFLDFGGPQPTAPSLMTRSPGFSSGFLPPAEAATESQQAEGQYPGRMYPEDLTSVARPRPLGSNSGPAQIHQLTQVGIASRMGAQSTELARSRSVQGFSGPVWPSYYSHEEETPRNAAHREAGHTHGAQDYSGPQMFSVNRGPNRQPGSHLPPSICYTSSSAEDVHPGHSSASLIKAIREELLRLSQKQVVAPTYHS